VNGAFFLKYAILRPSYEAYFKVMMIAYRKNILLGVDGVKRGQEAIAQYSELAGALRQMDADWIVIEVEEVIARGKTVPFRDLSHEESMLYERRLFEEVDRGIAVARAKPNDIIGVAYEPHERLLLLVEALERVITASELSRSYISRFASDRGIGSIELVSSVGDDATANALRMHGIPLEMPTLTNERLAILRHVLHDEVLS
jgi:hypothetical protein